MYDITADYHTHTIYSHGKGTIEENVQAARTRGLKKIAISDHGFGHIGYGIKKGDVQKMREEIQRLNEKYDDIEILLGIESNLVGLDGNIDIPEEYFDKFDIILMGFHKGAMPASCKDALSLFGRNMMAKLLSEKQREELRYINTFSMIKAMDRYPIDIITHPGAKIDIDSRLLAEKAAQTGIALEINASHGFMTADYVKIALEQGATFVINSDAHTPNRVGVFDLGIQIAREAALPPEAIINSRLF